MHARWHACCAAHADRQCGRQALIGTLRGALYGPSTVSFFFFCWPEVCASDSATANDTRNFPKLAPYYYLCSVPDGRKPRQKG